MITPLRPTQDLLERIYRKFTAEFHDPEGDTELSDLISALCTPSGVEPLKIAILTDRRITKTDNVLIVMFDFPLACPKILATFNSATRLINIGDYFL